MLQTLSVSQRQALIRHVHSIKIGAVLTAHVAFNPICWGYRYCLGIPLQLP